MFPGSNRIGSRRRQGGLQKYYSLLLIDDRVCEYISVSQDRMVSCWYHLCIKCDTLDEGVGVSGLDMRYYGPCASI